MTFDLPYDPFDLGIIQMRKVPCQVCKTEFWVPDRHPGPWTCSKECAEKRMLDAANETTNSAQD